MFDTHVLFHHTEIILPPDDSTQVALFHHEIPATAKFPHIFHFNTHVRKAYDDKLRPLNASTFGNGPTHVHGFVKGTPCRHDLECQALSCQHPSWLSQVLRPQWKLCL